MSKKDKTQQEEPNAKKRSKNKTQSGDKSQPTGGILDILEFDVEQTTTQADEACKDIKLIMKTVLKLEKTLETLQKAVEDNSKKLNKHIASCPMQLS